MWTHGSPCELRPQVPEVKASSGSHGERLQNFLVPQTLGLYQRDKSTMRVHTRADEDGGTTEQQTYLDPNAETVWLDTTLDLRICSVMSEKTYDSFH